jgi:hypothetical protein
LACGPSAAALGWGSFFRSLPPQLSTGQALRLETGRRVLFGEGPIRRVVFYIKLLDTFSLKSRRVFFHLPFNKIAKKMHNREYDDVLIEEWINCRMFQSHGSAVTVTVLVIIGVGRRIQCSEWDVGLFKFYLYSIKSIFSKLLDCPPLHKMSTQLTALVDSSAVSYSSSTYSRLIPGNFPLSASLC